ncbi:hypothetical protein [Euzebya tangerina]|uniref:hypothetical protein n=1 Tax=Euzebya tangerina TaxID=591198 RepID=UPI000E324B0F|nr:hypothetical protein [Euzebya tangerina]
MNTNKDDLSRRLHLAAPSPSRPLELDAAWERSRRRGVPPAAPLVLVATLLTVGLATLLLSRGPGQIAEPLDMRSGSAAADPDGPLYVLDRAADADDVPPPEASQSWAAALLPEEPDMRLATSVEGLSFYVTRDASDAICLLVTGVADGLTGACATEAVFELRGHLPLELVDGDYDPAPDVWAAIVPNGVASVEIGDTSARVQDNVAVVLRPPGDSLAARMTGSLEPFQVAIAASIDPDDNGESRQMPTAQDVDDPVMRADANGCVDKSAPIGYVDEALRATGIAVWWRSPSGFSRSAAPFGVLSSLSQASPDDADFIQEPQLIPRASQRLDDSRPACSQLAASPSAGLDSAEGVALAWLAAYDAGDADRLVALTAGGVMPGFSVDAFTDRFGIPTIEDGTSTVESIMGPVESATTEPLTLVTLTTAERRVEIAVIGGQATGGWSVADATTLS